MGIIRLLLAIAVVVGHSGDQNSPLVRDDFAVELFFIISGFYMALVLNGKYKPEASHPHTYRVFLESRFFRLFPMYFVALLLTLLVQTLWFAPYSPLKYYYGYIPALFYWKGSHLSIASFLFLAATNLLMFGQDAVMFLGLNHAIRSFLFTPNLAATAMPAWHFLFIPQAWSLGIEATFYLIAPFIVRRSTKAIVGLALLSLALRSLLRAYGLDHDPWTFRFFPTELYLFLFGALSFRVSQLPKSKEFLRTSSGHIALFVALLVICSRNTPLWLYPDLPKLLFVLCIPPVFALTKRSAIDRWIGELSYPLYLIHVLVLQILRFAGVRGNFPIILASVCAASLLMMLVDQPLQRLRAGWLAKRLE
jgi:peptidoglycan/LPS O-acetylase OafA/YrhL